MTRDFTHGAYSRLLTALRSAGYRLLTFSELASSTDPRSLQRHALLRHDVDRFPTRSLAMAELEALHGVRSTYFFRTKRGSFAPETMIRIQKLGHEIGYHYETLCDSRGDIRKAWRLFEDDLRRFAFLGGVTSIAMHGRPFSKWDSRELWKHYDYREHGVQIEAYRDIDWTHYRYLTDTGRSWASQHNVRDRVPGAIQIGPRIHSTDELCAYVEVIPCDLVISAHPERWSKSLFGWYQVATFDALANALKACIQAAARHQRPTSAINE